MTHAPTCRRWKPLSSWAWCFVAVLLSCSAAVAQDSVIPSRCHIWGPFEVGAWSRVQVDVEVYERGQRLHHVERTVTRVLKRRDEQGYQLDIDTWERLGVALGPRERRTTETGDYPWFVSADRLKDLGEESRSELEWQGETISCQVFEYETVQSGRVISHRDLFHADRFPFFLGRLVVRTPEGEPERIEAREYSRVIESEVPIFLGDRIVSGVLTKTTLDSPERSVVILEELAPEVPGGLVSKRVVERDRDGAIVRREVVSLVDFGDAGDWEQNDGESGQLETSRLRGRLFRRWNRADGSDDSRQ